MKSKPNVLEAAKSYLLGSHWGDGEEIHGYPPDEAVLDGLKTVVQNASPSHTLGSRPKSLLKLIRDHVDPPFSNWINANDLALPFPYSDLVLAGPGYGLGVIQEAMRYCCNDSSGANSLTATCDYLIEFLSFANALDKRHEKVVRVEAPRRGSSKNVHDRFGWSPILQKYSERTMKKLPWYLIGPYQTLRSNSECIACGLPTAASLELHRLRNANRESEHIEQLEKTNHCHSFNKGAYLYCENHSKNGAGSAGEKRGQRQMQRFLILLTVPIHKHVVKVTNTLFPPERASEFARIAINNRQCHSNIRLIESTAIVLYSRASWSEKQIAGQEISALLADIFINKLGLTPEPFDPVKATASFTLSRTGNLVSLDGRKMGIGLPKSR